MLYRLVFLVLALCATPAFTQSSPGEQQITVPGGTTASRLPLRAATGDLLDCTLRQDHGDFVLRLLDPSQQKVAEALDRGGDQRPLRIAYVAQASGAYTIEVTWRTPSKIPGTGRLLLMQPHPASPRDLQFAAASEKFHRASLLRSGHKRQALEDSIALLLDARAVWHSLEAREDEAEALRDLTETSAELGRMDDMLRYAEAEWRLRQQLLDLLGQANALNNLGYAENVSGHSEEGLAHLQQAIDLWRQLKDRRSEAISLSNLANAYFTQGDFYQSLSVCQELEPLRRLYSGPAGRGATQNCIGMSLVNLGEIERGVSYLKQAEDFFLTAGDMRGVATIHGNLASTYFDSGNQTQALTHGLRALEIARTIGNIDMEALYLGICAGAYTSSGQPDRGLEFAQQSLSKARNGHDRRTEVLAHRELARSLIGLHRYAEASTEAEAALQSAREATLAAEEILSLEIVAAVESAQGNPEAALAREDLAINKLEELRSRIRAANLRISYFAQKRRLYEAKVDTLMHLHQLHRDRGFDAAALEASEQSRARGLLDRLSGGGSPAHQVHPGLRVAQMQELLGDRQTVLLEFLLSPRQSYGWILTRNAVRGFSLPPESQIETAARQLHVQLRSNLDAAGSIAVLSRMLLGPAVANLRGATRILVVSDSGLQLVPFSVLSIPGADGQPLIVDHTVIALPSLSSLARPSRSNGAQGARHQLAVIADPVFQPDDFRFAPGVRPAAQSQPPSATANTDLLRLPGTLREARAILGLLPPGRGVLEATSFTATREFVLSPAVWHSRIVHLATHGLVNSASPEMSGLMFSRYAANGEARNGFVRIPELERLSISADLVVLSACQSALGKDVRGEGLMGMARALIAAGSRSVAGSLWQVPDSATVELMREFYTAMLRDRLAPAAALRRAQLALRRRPEWSRPYYWAAFELLGDWR